MRFLKFPPTPALAHLVKEFWLVENPDPTPRVQKIIPDGYCEIIFHDGDPFRIKLHHDWEIQERILFSGQISRHFYVQNTGSTGMLGIKLMPDAPHRMFGMHMPGFTDRVVPWNQIHIDTPPSELIRHELEAEDRISLAIGWLDTFNTDNSRNSRLSDVISEQISNHGMTGIESLAALSGMTRRHLEREFRKVVGLTPKYYSRIMQFNYIFEAIRMQDNSWVDVALNSGYFDQSHFIRNFKAFTGKSPTEYGFDENNLANFFLRKDK